MRISDWSSDVCSSDLLAVVDYLGSQGSIGALGVPKLVANTALSYEDDTAQFTIRNRFLSAGVNLATVPIENNRIPAYAYFDLGARVTVHAGDRSQFQLFAKDRKRTRLNSSH